MEEILRTTLLGLFFGTFGTTIGGILGVKLKNTSNKFLSFILSFAAGLMMSIVSFDLIPEAMNISGIPNVLIGILIGIVCMLFCEAVVDKKFNKDIKKGKLKISVIPIKTIKGKLKRYDFVDVEKA